MANGVSRSRYTSKDGCTSVAAKRYIQKRTPSAEASKSGSAIYFAVDRWRAQDLRRAFTISTELTLLDLGHGYGSSTRSTTLAAESR